MGKFTFTQTEIPGVVVIEPQVFGDDRGYFMETYQKDQFAEAGIDKEFVQDNQSRSTRGVLRGLHFQKNHTQGKLVRVTKGEVYDVAVDCRPHSATFGKWVGVTLSEENKNFDAAIAQAQSEQERNAQERESESGKLVQALQQLQELLIA